MCREQEQAVQTIVVDGLCWEIEFAGFAAPLRARLRDRSGPGESLELGLRPWSCARHFAALRRHLRHGSAGLELDGRGYADAVLEQVGELDAAAAREALLRPLALWWASGVEPGSEPQAVGRDAEGWVRLDAERSARVRPWTWGERLAAQRAHLHDADAGVDFDPVGYLDAMLRTCTSELRSRDSATALAEQLETLDAGATRALLAAVVDINHTEPGRDPLELLSPALAAATLRLCAAMGWTLERVLASPAVEVQRMLSLLERVEGPSRFVPRASPVSARAATRRPRLADHPDAVVIVFDQEGP